MSEPISIGELLILLKHCEPTAEVEFGFPGYNRPTKVSSYRGYYDMPALDYSSGAVMSVAMLIEELREATDGRQYTGWKGGEYTYQPSDFLWVANPGEAGGYVITGITKTDWRVMLNIAYHEY